MRTTSSNNGPNRRGVAVAIAIAVTGVSSVAAAVSIMGVLADHDAAIEGRYGVFFNPVVDPHDALAQSSNVHIISSVVTGMTSFASIQVDSDDDALAVAGMNTVTAMYRSHVMKAPAAIGRVLYPAGGDEEPTQDPANLSRRGAGVPMDDSTDNSTLSAHKVTTLTTEAIHNLTGVNEVRTKLGLTGTSVKVAVIDSGVFYTHPALGGGFGPGFKVVGGYDLVGDNYTGSNLPTPDDDPIDDCSSESHGTHVAGILAADATNITDPFYTPPIPFTGVAPDVSLLAYRVFGCAGGTSSDVVTEAILRAVHDGAHILNLSLGSGPEFDGGSDSYAADLAGQQGVFVFSSVGNDGTSGFMAVGSPAVASKGFGITSFENAESVLPTMAFSPSSKDFYSVSLGQNNVFLPLPPDTLEVVASDINADANNKQNDGCPNDPVVPPNATGKALLVRWGDKTICGSVARCNFAFAKANASACILYGSEATAIVGSKFIPSYYVPREAGIEVINSISGGVIAKAVNIGKARPFDVPTKGTISSNSSPGLTQELDIKPDLGGIGGTVLSTISNRAAAGANGENMLFKPYASYNGTSMSSPYVAGVAALVLQNYKQRHHGRKPSVRLMKTMLQNGATPRTLFGSMMLDSVARQGAGLVNAYQSAVLTTSVFPSSLALNDTDHTAETYWIAIQNNARTDVRYHIASQGAAMVNMFNPGDDVMPTIDSPLNAISYTPDYATVLFGTASQPNATVKIRAGYVAFVSVRFAPPANASADLKSVFSGYITITASNAAPDEAPISVPYAGMVGSWHNAPVWVRQSKSLDSVLQRPGNPYSTLIGNVPFSRNATLRAGLYDDLYTFIPLTFNQTINATYGAIFVPSAATTTRLMLVDILPGASDTDPGLDAQLTALAKSGIDVSLPIIMAINATFSFDSKRGAFSGYALTTPLSGAGSGILRRNSFQPTANLLYPSLQIWNGYVTQDVAANRTSASYLRLPSGTYRVRASAIRHFAAVAACNLTMDLPGTMTDCDTIVSEAFFLAY